MYKTIFLFVLFLFSSLFNLSAQNKKELKRPTVGLVLSGGGAKGFAHVGVLKVLEELEIPVDYITGTSMGSIIGGFYAMGYSAYDIEKMISEQNWDIVLTDYTPRKYVPLFDRDEYDRYAFSFPIKDKGIQLPDGIVHGQNVLKLFSKYSIKYHNVKDFSKLPIPFACAAADIVHGKEYIMENGYLPLVMRTSMSIPTIFTPIDYKDMVLVDGGMINNFPVIKAKQMGADIIIGVDVQKGKKTKAELRSMSDIMNQGIFFLGMETYKENRKFVDVYIKPDIDGYKVADFYSADSLIVRGERAARKMIPELLKLKEKLGDYSFNKNSERPPKLTDSLYVKSIKVKGLNKLSEAQVINRLHIKTPQMITIEDLEIGIDRLYSTLNFKTVMYRFSGEDSSCLELTVEEKITNRFNVGIHYDSWGDASILLNTTYNNILKKGSKLSFDLQLAETPRAMATYTINNGWKPGMRARLEYNNFYFYNYNKGRKIGEYLVDKHRADVNINSIISDAYSLGVGIRADYFKFNSQIEGESKYEKDNEYISYYGFLRMDTHEKAHYPREGVSVYGEYRLLMDGGDPYSILYFDFKKPVRLSSSVTLVPQLYLSGILNDTDKTPPAVAMTMWGGVERVGYMDNQIPFIGLRNLEFLRKSGAVLRADLQWEMWKRNYLILKANVGKEADYFKFDDCIWGGGITFGYDSVLGPMEASIMTSGENDRVTFLVNLGYWF